MSKKNQVTVYGKIINGTHYEIGDIIKRVGRSGVSKGWWEIIRFTQNNKLEVKMCNELPTRDGEEHIDNSYTNYYVCSMGSGRSSYIKEDDYLIWDGKEIIDWYDGR